MFIRDRTAEDGSDLGSQLARLFQILNTDTSLRQCNLDEELNAFPYVNGELFAEPLGFAEFNADMRNGCSAAAVSAGRPSRLPCSDRSSKPSWTARNAARFGAHYTAEKNILKLIRSLFLDELRAELENIKADRSTRRTARLEEFHEKLAGLRFFDPACGCGNFLVITYRELRKLELEVLVELQGPHSANCRSAK